MELPDSKNAKVDLTPDGIFTFSASAGAGDHLYELKLELFDKVNVEVRIDYMHAQSTDSIESLRNFRFSSL